MESTQPTLAARMFAADRRRTSRIDVSIWGLIRIRDQTEHPVRISNISQTGFLVITSASMPDHTEFQIELPKIGWLTARSLWSLGNRVGGQFEPAIDLDRYHLLQQCNN